MSKLTLHVISPPHGSIAEITNDLLPYFKDEFITTVEGEEEPKGYDVLLSHFVMSGVVVHKSFKKFKKKILIQPIDGTSIYPDVVESINEYDLIITPGEAGKQIMIKNGVVKPILVIRNFYKDNVFLKPLDLGIPEIPNDKIIFYHESTCHPRKGMEILYEGFIKAFSDTEFANKVVLIVKGPPFISEGFKQGEKLKQEVINLQSKYASPAQIIKISQSLKMETLKKLWHNTNIYVSMSKIEGFGIPLLRMGLLQKPIIALDAPCSGYIDWLNKDNAYLIPTRLVTAEEEFMFLYKQNTKWAIPTNIDLVIKAFQDSLKDFMDGKSKLVDSKELEDMHINIIAEKYITTIKNIKNTTI